MTEINKGSQYRAARVRSGNGARGSWELIVVTDENGKGEITIFVDNRPSCVAENGFFIVKDITGVKRKKRKDSNGTWRDEFSITAVVEPVQSEFDTSEPADDGASPWDNSPNPFDDELPY